MREGTPDLLVLNAKVKSMDLRGSTYGAIGITSGLISHLGTTEELRGSAGPDTVVLDAGSRTVLPGFIDAHSHWGLASKTLALAVECLTPPTMTIGEIIKRGQEAARKTPPGRWIFLQGSNFQELYIQEKRFPTIAELDAVSTVHPVLYKTGLHEMIVNHKALEVAGIDRNTPDPAGAHIHRDADGEPTGVLAEMFGHLPLPTATAQDIRASLKRLAMEHYLANGVTSVQEIWDSLDVLQAQAEMIRSREIPLRITGYGWLNLAGTVAEISSLQAPGVEQEPGWMELRGAKLFADGGTPSFTAAYYDEYPGQPGNRGTLTYSDDELAELIGVAHRAGAQIMVHASGDRSADQVLRAYERENARRAPGTGPHRIEHGGNTAWTDERGEWCKRLGVLPVPNVGFISSYAEFWPGAIGEERTKRCVPLRSMFDMGLDVPGTSDTSGGALYLLKPLHSIWRAITRTTFSGMVVGAGERISLDEGLTMYTRFGANAGGYGDTRGTLEQGKVGDLIVLSEDVDAVVPEQLDGVDVVTTVVAGNVVYSSEGLDVPVSAERR